MKYLSGLSTLLLALLLWMPGTVQAQAFLGAGPRVTFDVQGGVASFGRFLEQRLDGGERELTAQTSGTVRAALGFRPGDTFAVQVAVDYFPTEFEFQDDSGIDSDALDLEELAEVRASVVSLEVVRYLWSADARVAPYGLLGVSGAFWNLDDDARPGLISAMDDTQFRVGGITGGGVQVQASSALTLRAEATVQALGNPFDGENAFRADSGETFGEPRATRVMRFTVGLGYAF